MNILLTSAGRRTYMIEYFKIALQGIGNVYASNSIFTNSLLKADDYVLTPNIFDSSYIDFLIKYCKEKEITAIISLFDIDLPILAKNKSYFKKNNIELVVSNYDATQICNDKWATYNFLLDSGIKQTKSYINISKVKEELKNSQLFFPLFIKPRWGMGSIGIYKIDNEEELDILYKKLKREIFNTYLKYESAADENSCIIIQQAIKGQEYGIEILNDLNEKHVTTFAKKKIAMRSGETDIAETVDATPFEKTAKIISEKLKHIGVLDVDCFITENGEIYVLEMNCRFGGQYPFTHLAGVNVPLQIIKWLKGENTEMSILHQINGIRSCKELTPITFQ